MVIILFLIAFLYGLDNNDALSLIIKWIIGALLIVFLATKYISLSSFEPLNGKLGGKIKLDKKGFHFNDKDYDLNKIEDISIVIGNYYNKRISTTTADPGFSNGVDNKLYFREAGLYKYYHFQINSKEHMLEFIEYIKMLNDLVKITVYYQDRPIKIKEFDPLLFGLI